uniref:Uncharacterized protein n=1 Tax=Heterorhabditis bacteriophora TaxID=37862 RepID=A0A1I7WFZ0_HETBA
MHGSMKGITPHYIRRATRSLLEDQRRHREKGNLHFIQFVALFFFFTVYFLCLIYILFFLVPLKSSSLTNKTLPGSFYSVHAVRGSSLHFEWLLILILLKTYSLLSFELGNVPIRALFAFY